MKIQWLNPECTSAVITRGWFRKRTAIVQRTWNAEWREWHWHFASGRYVSDSDKKLAVSLTEARQDELDRQIDARRKQDDQRDWVDTGSFPKARALKGRTQ